jgi:soluble lytic murein transglycosylase-like protein
VHIGDIVLRFSPTWWIVTRAIRVFIILIPWLLLFAQSWILFNFPIKQDRYKHSFFRHIKDRLLAYLYLMNSQAKFGNTKLRIETINQIIEDTAREYEVDRCLIQSIVIYESGYYANTITSTGAMGLMALMPATAKRLGVSDPFHPARNIEGGTRLIRQLLTEFEGNIDLVLAAYNAGEESVMRFSGIPPYEETLDYVQHIRQIHRVCKLSATQAKPESL